MTIALVFLTWYNTVGIQMMVYGRNSNKMNDASQRLLRKENVGPTLAQSVDARSKMMSQKKGTCAMSAEEKNFRDYVMNGNRSYVTWNGNLLDGASPPLRASAAYLRAKGATLTPKTPTNG